MKVFSPTYKRAGRVKTRKIVPDLILVCHEFEKEEYLAKEGEPIMAIPDELRGNIGKVRNWILDHAGDEHIVMMDDDIRAFGYCENDLDYSIRGKEFKAFLKLGFTLAEDLGVHLWGVNLQSDPKFYRVYAPFSLTAPVLGPFSCHIRPILRYEFERFKLKEDYDFFLQNIRKYHKVLRFNKYHYFCDHIETSGGCAAYRLRADELRDLKEFQKKWGSKVVQFNFKRSINPRIFVPISGI